MTYFQPRVHSGGVVCWMVLFLADTELISPAAFITPSLWHLSNSGNGILGYWLECLGAWVTESTLNTCISVRALSTLFSFVLNAKESPTRMRKSLTGPQTVRGALFSTDPSSAYTCQSKTLTLLQRSIYLVGPRHKYFFKISPGLRASDIFSPLSHLFKTLVGLSLGGFPLCLHVT